MTKQAGIRVEGLDAIVKTFKEADPELNKRVRKVHAKIAKIVTTEAKKRATVGRTRMYQNSIKPSASPRYAAVRGGKNIPYFHRMQWGQKSSLSKNQKTYIYRKPVQGDFAIFGAAGKYEKTVAQLYQKWVLRALDFEQGEQ